MAIVENTQFGRVGAFKFWCQKVLPAVYDDSLSYYELLCKVVHYLNTLADEINNQADAITELQEYCIKLEDLLNRFLDGEFTDVINAYIAQWFDENEPEITADIAQLQLDLSNLSDSYSDYVIATNNSIGAIELAIDAIEKFIEEVDVTSFIIPRQMGVIRIPTHLYDDNVSEDTVRWGQGLCFHDGYIYQLVSNGTASSNTKIYTKAGPSGSVSFETTVNAGKGSSIAYIPDINQYYVGTGNADEIVRLDSTLTRVGRMTIGNTDEEILLAYDKKQNKLYGSHYGVDLFEFPSDYGTSVTYLSQWDSINTDSGHLQDIAAYDGVLYLLYSNVGRIEKWDIETHSYIGEYLFPNRMRNKFLGECEGIDIANNGQIYFSATIRLNDMRAYDYCYLWRIDTDNPSFGTGDWFPTIAGSTRFVHNPSEANLNGSQLADGSSSHPYPTIGEAMMDLMINPWLNVISITGNHADEKIYVSVPNITIEGDSDNPPDIGQIYTRAAKTSIRTVNVNPQTTVDYNIFGYRNGILNVDNTVTFGTDNIPTGGHNIATQGYFINNYTYTYAD